MRQSRSFLLSGEVRQAGQEHAQEVAIGTPGKRAARPSASYSSGDIRCADEGTARYWHSWHLPRVPSSRHTTQHLSKKTPNTQTHKQALALKTQAAKKILGVKARSLQESPNSCSNNYQGSLTLSFLEMLILVPVMHYSDKIKQSLA